MQVSRLKLMTIGESLRRARNERQLTLEQAAKLTHIRLHYLEALESDSREGLPSTAQAKGFIRLYAGFLGIPSQPLLNAWENIASGLAEEAIEPKPDNEKSTSIQEPYSKPEPPTVISSDTSAPKPILPVATQPKQVSISNAIFKEIGQALRKQRENLGLSLNDVEQFTHVRLHYLQAIEEGILEKLPSPVQGRGMISNYAHFLDMDGDKILLRFADGLQAQHSEHEPILKNSVSAPKSNKVQRPPQKTPVRRLVTPDLLIGGLIVISLVIFAAWSTLQVIKSRNEHANQSLPEIPDVLLVTSTPDILKTGTQVATSPSQEGTVVSSQPLPGIDLTQTLMPVVDAPLQVYVVALLRTYMLVTVDGEVKFDGRVVPGIAYPFSGNTQIELAAGNGAALQVYFNQTDLGMIGTLGESVSLDFTLAGIQTPTPQFTSTPTITQPATATLLPSPTPETPTITPMIP